VALRVPIVIEEEAGRYYARCPDLEGCRGEGRTPDEAVALFRKALASCFPMLPEEERRRLLSRWGKTKGDG
jgi:predicted RNase H-like HicB family nuclease